jgi:hypothetical protein
VPDITQESEIWFSSPRDSGATPLPRGKETVAAFFDPQNAAGAGFR